MFGEELKLKGGRGGGEEKLKHGSDIPSGSVFQKVPLKLLFHMPDPR